MAAVAVAEGLHSSRSGESDWSLPSSSQLGGHWCSKSLSFLPSLGRCVPCVGDISPAKCQMLSSPWKGWMGQERTGS